MKSSNSLVSEYEAEACVGPTYEITVVKPVFEGQCMKLHFWCDKKLLAVTMFLFSLLIIFS